MPYVGGQRTLLSTNNSIRRGLRNGLVGYWRLNEASGTRADSSGNGYHLTDNNTVLGGVGPGGELALASDLERDNGESLSLTLGAGNLLIPAASPSFTWFGWANKESDPGDFTMLVRLDTTASGRGLLIMFEGGTSNKYEFWISTDNATWTDALVSTATTPSDAAWFAWRAWFDASAGQMGIQINLTTKNTQAVVGTPIGGTNTFSIGDVINTAQTWDGLQAGVGKLNRMMTDAEWNWFVNNKKYLL